MPALYDMFSRSLLVVVLLMPRRKPRRDRFLILVAAAWKGTGRFVEDLFRIDDKVALGLSEGQPTAAVLVIASSASLAL